MKKIFIIGATIFMVGSALGFGAFKIVDNMASIKASNENKNKKIAAEYKKDIEIKPIKYSINAFGDLLMHGVLFKSAKIDDSYNFTSMFDDIAHKVKESDFTIGNLEVPTAGNKDGMTYSTYPAFNCPEQVLDAMDDVLDVELLSTATNHTLDKGFKGLENTLDFIGKAGIESIGSYANEESSKEIYIKEIKDGAKIAFLNYTYGTNGIPIPKEHPYSVNLIDIEKIKSDANKATELGADFIVLKIHWGNEYALDESGHDVELENLDNTTQRGLAKELFEETNINLIIGDHPHVVQNIEEMSVENNGSTKQGTVIYSLGNFISGQNKKYRDTGIIAKANIIIDRENPENTGVENIEYTPVFVDRNLWSNNDKYRVLDINKAIEDYENKNDDLISSEEYSKMIDYKEYYRIKLLKDDFVYEN